MRILHIIADVHKSGGGTSEVVPRLALEQRRLGHKVTIAALESEISDSMRDAIAGGVDYVDEANISCMLPKALGFSSKFNGVISPLVARADIIHLHGLWMYPCWCAGWMAQKMRKPYVMMPHGFLEPERLKISQWKKKIVGRLVERQLFKFSSGIIATSESERNGIKAYGLEQQVYIMPIGLDCEPIDQGKYNEALLKRLGCDLSKKLMLYFSRITPIKGLDILAEVWREVNHDGWQLVIVGPDDRGYTNEVKLMYEKEIKSGSVVIHDAIYGRDKYDLLNSVDAFVLPTRSENWSVAVAEAMAARLPVVCTKGAPWECINKVNAGFWVDANYNGLYDAVNRLITLSEHERSNMGANGRKWVGENLGWSAIVDGLIAFYRNVLNEKMRG